MRLPLQCLTEVTSALQPKGHCVGMEKRRALRRSVGGRVQIIPVDGAVRTPFTVLLQDISLTGLGILGSRRMEEGQRFAVIMPRVEMSPLSVVCVARSCSEVADGIFRVGAAFQQVVRPKGKAPPTSEKEPAAASAETNESLAGG
jgi:hypothetical protein